MLAKRRKQKMAKAQKQIANASQTAKLLGVDPITVINWAKRGCPVISREPVGRKTRWVFDVSAVKEWRRLDLERRKKPRTEPMNPLPISKGLMMSKEDEIRFRRTMERLMRPSHKHPPQGS